MHHKFNEDLRASEALYGFVAMLSARSGVLSIGSSEPCGNWAEIVADYIRANNLRPPREHYEYHCVPEIAESVRVSRATAAAEVELASIKRCQQVETRVGGWSIAVMDRPDVWVLQLVAPNGDACALTTSSEMVSKILLRFVDFMTQVRESSLAVSRRFTADDIEQAWIGCKKVEPPAIRASQAAAEGLSLAGYTSTGLTASEIEAGEAQLSIKPEPSPTDAGDALAYATMGFDLAREESNNARANRVLDSMKGPQPPTVQGVIEPLQKRLAVYQAIATAPAPSTYYGASQAYQEIASSATEILQAEGRRISYLLGALVRLSEKAELAADRLDRVRGYADADGDTGRRLVHDLRSLVKEIRYV